MALLITQARNELVRRVVAADPPRRLGRPRSLTVVQTLDRIMYVCRTGCQWSQLPTEGHVSYKTVYHRFNVWSKRRVFEDAFYNLARLYTAERKLPLVVDTTSVKNVFGTQVCGRNHADRARKATKVSLLADSTGTPLTLAFHACNKNDCTTFRHLLDIASSKLSSLRGHGCVYADKGYDSLTNRAVCARHELAAHIPRRGTVEGWSSVRYVVEVVFARLDRFRRVIMRYDAGPVSIAVGSGVFDV